MGKKNIYINNIPVVNAHIVELTDNLIVCNSIREEFFGISTILLENKEIICEHSGDIVTCNVRIDDNVYDNVPFNLIIDKDAKSKIAINKNTLKNPSFFYESKLEQENDNIIEEIIAEPIIEEVDSSLVENLKEKENIIKTLNEEITNIKKQKILKEEKVENFIDRKIEKGIESYKQKLYNDFFIISEEQSEIKKKVINETIQTLKEIFDEKYITLVSEIKKTSSEETENAVKTFITDLEKTLTTNQDLSLEQLKTLVENTIKEDLFIVTDELKNTIKIQINENIESVNSKLESYKQSIKDDIIKLFESDNLLLKESIRDDFYAQLLTVRDELKGEWPEREKKIEESLKAVINVIEEKENNLAKSIINFKDEIISDYLKDIDTNKKEIKDDIYIHLEELNKKIDNKKIEHVVFDSNDLVLQATKSLIEEDSKTTSKLRKFKDQLLKDLQKAAEQYTQEANRRMLRYAEMMSGGGSTAVQFANGGTMNGNLNINGAILSAGKDITTLFSSISSSGGGTGRDDVNTAVIANSANWTNAYNTASEYVQISGSYITNTILRPLTSLLLPTTIYQQTSSNWQDTYTTVYSNSSNWQNAFFTGTTYQNSSAAYATLQYTNDKFLPLSGGTLTNNLSVYGNVYFNNNLTVAGNLTALGTATFANTIFTTTSALSIINTGPGPALYVFQAAGPYDVASFYDGDGIEVLHVGNAGPGGFGKVGINESFPNEELTVRGSISATEVIYTENGNSTNWSTAYQNVSSQSLNTTDNVQFNQVNVGGAGELGIVNYGLRYGGDALTLDDRFLRDVNSQPVIGFGNDYIIEFYKPFSFNTGPNPAQAAADSRTSLGLGSADNVEFNQVNANVYLSGGVNLYNLLSSSGGGGGDPAVNTVVYTTSATWNNTTTIVQSNSASWFEPVRRFDYVTVANVDISYSGTAPFGTLDTTPVWKLIRLTYANNGTISNQASAINSWTGRLTAVYI